MPFFGGPTGLNTSGTKAGEPAFAYGNSPYRAGVKELAPKDGVVFSQSGSGCTHAIYFFPPTIFGDSGSAVLDSAGRALGLISIINTTEGSGSTGVPDLGRMLAYAQRHSGIAGLRLVEGSETFHTR